MKKSQGYIVIHCIKKNLGNLFVNKSTQTQLLDFVISEKIMANANKQEKAIPTEPYVFDEKEFKKMFKNRCYTLGTKTLLKKEDIDALWKKVMACCDGGFVCEYCGEFLNIHSGNKNVFSFDHKNNDYSEFKIDEISIVCLGCNLFKRGISEKNFKSLITMFRTTKNMDFYDEMKEEIIDGIEKGKQRAKANGIMCHRPRKDIDLDMVKEQYGAGIPLNVIAKNLKVSYSTLRNRLHEANIRVEFFMEKEETPISE